MNDNVVRMYKGVVDAVYANDGVTRLFAIKNERVAPSTYGGDNDRWLNPIEFGPFSRWDSTPVGGDEAVIKSIPNMELIWEKQE